MIFTIHEDFSQVPLEALCCTFQHPVALFSFAFPNEKGSQEEAKKNIIRIKITFFLIKLMELRRVFLFSNFFVVFLASSFCVVCLVLL